MFSKRARSIAYHKVWGNVFSLKTDASKQTGPTWEAAFWNRSSPQESRAQIIRRWASGHAPNHENEACCETSH